MLYSLDSRCQEILQHLLYTESYMSISNLAKEKNISKRSVYYDLCKINDWLDSHQIDSILIERKKGIYITSEHRQKILELLKNVSNNSMYLFSPMERVKIIICTILKKSSPLFIEDFINLCHVSRNTIISDLKVVIAKLQESNLTLIYENKEGYYIQGDTIKKRSIFFLMFSNLFDLYLRKIIPLDNASEVYKIYDNLCKIEQELSADYVRGVLFSIAVFFSSIDKQNEQLFFSIKDKIEISHTKEYQLVCKYFSNFNESEQYYLSLHLLGSRLQTVPINLMKENDQESYILAKALVTEFSRISCIEFDDIDGLEQALFAHLKTSLYRYRYGIQLGNPMLDDIKNQYHELFEITKKACEYLEQQIGVPIPDGEIAYITLHFGGYIQNNRNIINLLNILIVCPNGISTGNMLRKEVRNLISNAGKIDVIALSAYDSQKDYYDITISTVTIENARNLIIVHPILTDNDRVLIMRKCMRNAEDFNMDISSILKIAKSYIEPAHFDKFKTELMNTIFSKKDINLLQKQNYGNGIMYYLDNEHTHVIQEPICWQDAIRYLGCKLLQDDCIEERYIQAVIEKNISLGPCMFITDKVVLAHAKVEDGALQLGLNLGVFKEPVIFENNRSANIIIFLVAVNQESHLHILNDIMTIFSDKSNVEKLSNCTNKAEIIKTIHDIIVQ